MKHLTLDLDGPIHALEWDGSGPPLLLVHGLDGSAANWFDVGPQLADGHHVVALDLPGFGRSPKAGRPVSMRALGELAARALRLLFPGEAAALAGNSMGAPIVLQTAARHPELVSSVTLAAPALPRAGTLAVDPTFAGLLLPYAIPALARIEPARRARLAEGERVRSLLDLCYAPGRRESQEAFDEMVDVARTRTREDAIRAWVEASRDLFVTLARRDAFHRLADEVTAPVLVVEGGADPVIPHTSVVDTLARHPSWVHVVLDGVGHVPQLEAPDRFVAAVSRLVLTSP